MRKSAGITVLLGVAWIAACGEAFTSADGSDAATDTSMSDTAADAPGDAGNEGAAGDAAADTAVDAFGDAAEDAPVPPPLESGADAPFLEGGVDAGPPSWSPVCPDTRPVVGKACDHKGAVCEYGQQFDVACDAVFQCVGGSTGGTTGTWAKDTSFAVLGCQLDGPNSALCPPTYAVANGGGSTTGGGKCLDKGLRCTYAPGVCVCGAPMGGGPAMIDAGMSFSCDPGPGCPMPRPRLGASCAGSQSCVYQSCEFGETCNSGYWQSEGVACSGTNP